MRRIVVCFAMAIGISVGLGTISAVAEGKDPIVGTWKLLSFSRHDLANDSDSNIVGEHPTGYITFTLGGHMVVWLVGDNRKPPSGTVATDAERLAWFKDIISAYGGTYSVEGNKYVMHIESAWIPAWYGTDQTRYFSFDGSKLVVKTAPFKSAFDGRDVVNTLIFEKVE